MAFHGSTNRTPYPQAGYFVCFVPFNQGRPSGTWEVFADGFAQVDTIVNTSDAVYRPMGLATGPDGSLYITDSNEGKIWRIIYRGNPADFGTDALARMEARKSLPHLRTPDPVRDHLQRTSATTSANHYLTYCAPCHQRDGKGAEGRFPPLTDAAWIAGNKEKLIQTVLFGMSGNVQVGGETFNNIMPSFSYLDNKTIAGILSYVRQNFGNEAEEIVADDIAAVRKRLSQ